MNYHLVITISTSIALILILKYVSLWIISGFTYFCVFYTLQSFWKKRKKFVKWWKWIKFWIVSCIGFDPFYQPKSKLRKTNNTKKASRKNDIISNESLH